MFRLFLVVCDVVDEVTSFGKAYYFSRARRSAGIGNGSWKWDGSGNELGMYDYDQGYQWTFYTCVYPFNAMEPEN